MKDIKPMTNKMWVIVDRRNKIQPNTVRWTRKECTDSFTNGSAWTWGYLKKYYGWKCIKVSVTLNPS